MISIKQVIRKKSITFNILLFSYYLFPIHCSYPQPNELLTGADIFVKNHLDLIKGKRVGIVTNHTAILKNGVHIADTLNSIDEISITALFGPEHGIRGMAPAGKKIESGIDMQTGIPVFSLYGKDRKPTKEMLKNVDIILYDIQDVGVRFYTYISTLFYVLEAAAENNIPVIVLDRPNPVDGVTIEGPVLDESLKSFVGIAHIPVRYAMTPGELAEYFSNEILPDTLKPDLRVIKMQGWKRDSYHNEYDYKWIPPSPNIPDIQSALVYPGTCLLEGTNISEGRGTENPFRTIGAPFINSEELLDELMKRDIRGAELKPVSFTPVAIQGVVESPKYRDEVCNGISIKVKDKSFRPFEFAIKLISSLVKLYPDDFKFNSYFDRLSGDKNLKEQILQGKSFEEISRQWQKELEEFKSIRNKYLLY